METPELDDCPGRAGRRLRSRRVGAGRQFTPLGSSAGEFCAQDRALVFHDPNGTRLLYDPGHTVAGGGDPRLGRIDVVLLNHMHDDHLGEAHIKAEGTCARPEVPVPTPGSNAVGIALAKKAKIVKGREMPPFFAARLKKDGGNPAIRCWRASAAYVIDDLVKPASVIPSHANEDGKAREGSRTEAFVGAVHVPLHVPLSGRTMSFDGNGKCMAGC